MQWTLRSRLEAAERQRRLDTGHAPAGAEPAGAPAPAATRADQDVIDLTDSRARALAKAVGAEAPAPVATRTPVPAGTPLALRQLGRRTLPPESLPVWQPIAPVADTPRAADPVYTTQPTKDRCPQCQGSVRLSCFDLDRALAEMVCLDCGLQYTAKSPKL